MNEQQLQEVQAFFASRARGWEERFAEDDARFEEAIAELAPPTDGRVLDVGCGTGRAIRFLRRAVGPGGEVVAVDATPEMLGQARALGRDRLAALLVADGERLPFGAGVFQAILAAGFIPHLSNPAMGLAELARATSAGGRLAIFHPIGRATLAARHGGTPSDDDAIAPARLPALLAGAGWRLQSLDDGVQRYLALAVRD